VALEVFVRVLLPIVVVVGAGFLLRRRLGLDVRSVNRVSIYLLSPALIFVALTEARLGAAETLRLGTFVTVFVLSIGLLTWFVSRALGYDTATTSALTLCAAFMNAGN
jgi:predicted permease